MGKRIRDCFIKMEESFEEQRNVVLPRMTFIKCYEDKDPEPACDPPSQTLGYFINNAHIVRAEWQRIEIQ